MKKAKSSEWNWITFLNRAIKEEPSEKESIEACNKANLWPTCACGQLCKDLPRNEIGEPEDLILNESGMEFYNFVCFRNWVSALETFHFIEARTIVLLNQQVKQSTNHTK